MSSQISNTSNWRDGENNGYQQTLRGLNFVVKNPDIISRRYQKRRLERFAKLMPKLESKRTLKESVNVSKF